MILDRPQTCCLSTKKNDHTEILNPKTIREHGIVMPHKKAKKAEKKVKSDSATAAATPAAFVASATAPYTAPDTARAQAQDWEVIDQKLCGMFKESACDMNARVHTRGVLEV